MDNFLSIFVPIIAVTAFLLYFVNYLIFSPKLNKYDFYINFDSLNFWISHKGYYRLEDPIELGAMNGSYYIGKIVNSNVCNPNNLNVDFKTKKGFGKFECHPSNDKQLNCELTLPRFFVFREKISANLKKHDAKRIFEIIKKQKNN